MKLTVKVIAILLMSAMTIPVFMMHGCGNNNTTLNGGSCGGCSNSPAPFGSTIVATTLSGAPSAATGTCYPRVSFTVLGSDGKPMSDICIEFFTDGASAIAKAPEAPASCNEASLAPLTSLVTRTNTSGVVVLEFLVPSSTAGTTFFVEGASCAISTVAATPGSV